MDTYASTTKHELCPQGIIIYPLDGSHNQEDEGAPPPPPLDRHHRQVDGHIIHRKRWKSSAKRDFLGWTSLNNHNQGHHRHVDGHVTRSPQWQ